MNEKDNNGAIPPFSCNMYAIGVKRGRAEAARDILNAIDDFLKYDYPDEEDCSEYGKGFIWGLKKAQQIVKDWGGDCHD